MIHDFIRIFVLMFRFRQFQIRDDRCAMKVGTDGVLLGAWATVEGARRILDIGTGSGLIALMAAQRAPQAQVVGVEIDPEASSQARENVVASPFADRVEVHCCDVRDYHSSQPFDCILCNPPFFVEDTLPSDHARAMARHSSLLRFSDLLASVSRLLDAGGLFHVILPYDVRQSFVDQAFVAGLRLVRQCHVRTVPRKPFRRAMLSFSTSGTISTEAEVLTLMDAQGQRTEAYATLARDFYL